MSDDDIKPQTLHERWRDDGPPKVIGYMDVPEEIIKVGNEIKDRLRKSFDDLKRKKAI